MTSPARIRTLVVDDESLAREWIKRQIAGDPELELVGECERGNDAVREIGRRQPDLVFLDVQLPDVDGFGVLDSLESLESRVPAVIFVTAYDEFALRAFEVHAFDYILKPFSPERFREALHHAKERLAAPSPADEEAAGARPNEPSRDGYLERLLVGENERSLLIATADVDWFEASRNVVILHAGTRLHTFRTTMENLASALDPAHFARIHRSAIVNLDRIREVQSWFHGNWRVILKDGTSLMLSSRYRESLERFRRVR